MPRMDKIYDAAVVGAGPAGSSSAITLRRAGFEVVLLEARSFPHDKLCGEFLSPECSGWLANLGINVQALGARPVANAAFIAPDGTTVEIPFPRPGWGLSRRQLDAALAQRSISLGVDLRENTAVTKITGDLARGFCIETSSEGKSTEIRARTAIAAYGKRAALDRVLNRPFLRRPQPFVALKRHYHGPSLGGQVALYTFPGGYCGLAEIEGGETNVCLLVRDQVFRSASKSGDGHIESFLDWMMSQNAQLAAWLAHAMPADQVWLSIAQVPFDDKSAAVGDILMAGDSGGLIAPLAGDGIAMALQSGGMAAQRCIQFLEGKTDKNGMPLLYARDWKRAFKSRLWLGRALQHVTLNPILARPALEIMNAVPFLGTYLMTRTRDLGHV